MRKYSVLIAIFILLPLCAGSMAFQNGYDLFQKALAKERGEGNLEEAIALYQKVIDETNDESLAAKAQLRVGICLEKLGQKKAKEAQKAYQMVIDNYPGQTETVRIAKEKLAVLLRVQALVKKGDKDFRIRSVWKEPKWDITGAPSPDGKYLSFVDWDTGDLAIRELATGKIRHLTDKGSYEESPESTYDSIWSPDSKQIAYCWENDQEDYVDLRVIRLDDKKPSILQRVRYSDEWIEPGDWSPDGKYILARLHREGFKFVLLSVADGSLRILKEFDELEPYNNPGGGLFSADGQYIAYDSQQSADTPNHDIFLFSIDKKSDVPLASHPAHDYLLGWAPDGKKIIFASDRSGTTDLWIIPVKNGKPIGDPTLLRRNIGTIKPLGWTQNGSFYFSTGKGAVGFDIYTATIDSGTGEVMSSPKKLALPYEGNNKSPVWSPNGKHLAYISRRGPLNRQTLCIYSLETGKIQVIPFKSQVGMPRWSPDGRFILVYVLGEGIWKVDVQTKNFSSLIESKKGFPAMSPNIAPDNRSLFYVWFDRDKKVTHVMACDLKTKKERELYSIPFYEHNMVLSPDGQKLALMCSENPYENKKKKHMLKIIPVDRGEAKEAYSFIQEGSWGLVDIAWSPDGRYIFFDKISSKARDVGPPDWELWRVPVEGGTAENLGLVMGKLTTFSIHPDGQQIAISSSTLGIAPAPEVWVMENFIPKAKTKKESRPN